jgi:hypothetical protein
MWLGLRGRAELFWQSFSSRWVFSCLVFGSLYSLWEALRSYLRHLSDTDPERDSCWRSSAKEASRKTPAFLLTSAKGRGGSFTTRGNLSNVKGRRQLFLVFHRQCWIGKQADKLSLSLSKSQEQTPFFLAIGYPSPPSGWIWTLPDTRVIISDITI